MTLERNVSGAIVPPQHLRTTGVHWLGLSPQHILRYPAVTPRRVGTPEDKSSKIMEGIYI